MSLQAEILSMRKFGQANSEVASSVCQMFSLRSFESLW